MVPSSWTTCLQIWRHYDSSVHIPVYFSPQQNHDERLRSPVLLWWCIEKEKPTRCHWMVYCTYNTLNMFQAFLCPSSGARDYMCVITTYGVQCLVAGCQVQDSRLCVQPEGCCMIVLGCWLTGIRCRTAGYVSGKRDVAWLQSCNIPLSGHTACCPALDARQPATKHCTP